MRSNRERPTGGISGAMYEYGQQLERISQHAAAEGLEVHMRAAIDVHPRAAYPRSYRLRAALQRFRRRLTP